jgi:4-amino-4-deoxy-L-arabinose transferase-like glycosyltransferase
VALLTHLGGLWARRRVGLLAAFLMVSQPFFIKKTIEIRPDLLALPFFLAALAALLRGVSPRVTAAGRRTLLFALAGLSLGSAIMCTQKMLFVLPGVLAGLGLWVLTEERVARTAQVLLFLAGALLPGVATWAAFRRLHAGDYFILNNFLLNARWARIPAEQLVRFVGTSAPVVALAAYWAVRAVPGMMRADRRDPGDALLLCLVVWLFVAIEFIPAAQMQYYLMPLPIVCLFAARALDELAGRLGGRVWPWALGALAILPLVNLGMDLSMTNRKQIAQLRQVAETTKPTDLVMDGWQGMGVFRPNAFYYYFINDEILRMIPPERFGAFMDDMEAGRRRPALIVLDRRLVALGPRFRAFVNAHYSSRDGFFYYWAG